jgi:hypothetical protein
MRLRRSQVNELAAQRSDSFRVDQLIRLRESGLQVTREGNTVLVTDRGGTTARATVRRGEVTRFERLHGPRKYLIASASSEDVHPSLSTRVSGFRSHVSQQLCPQSAILPNYAAYPTATSSASGW